MTVQEASERLSHTSYMDSFYATCEKIPWRKVFVVTLVAALILLPMMIPVAAAASSSRQGDAPMCPIPEAGVIPAGTSELPFVFPPIPDHHSMGPRRCELLTSAPVVAASSSHIEPMIAPLTCPTEVIETLSSMAYDDPISGEIQPVGQEIAQALLARGLEQREVEALMGRGLSPERMIGIARLFPELEGSELFEKLSLMYPGKRPAGLTEYQEGYEACFAPHPDRPQAIILSGGVDINGAISRRSPPQKNLMDQLARVYNFCRYSFNSLSSLVEQAGRMKDYDLMILHMHGHPESGELSEHAEVAITDYIPPELFRNLAADGTLLLYSCSTGRGRGRGYNLANHFANALPEGVRLIAPDQPVTFVTMTHFNPLEVSMSASSRLERLGRDLSYEPTKEDCPTDQISPLTRCGPSPIRVVRKSYFPRRGYSFALQFGTSMRHQALWQDISPDRLRHLQEKGFSNAHLERLASIGMTLEEVFEYSSRFDGYVLTDEDRRYCLYAMRCSPETKEGSADFRIWWMEKEWRNEKENPYDTPDHKSEWHSWQESKRLLRM